MKILSIVIPVMNEEDNINILAEEIDQAMTYVDIDWECLWIDDYSTDNTRNVLIEMCRNKQNHRYLFHNKNYGQSAALISGFKDVNSKYIATLDGDGQNDPASLPGLIKKIMNEDADVVNGWRQKRNDSVVRKISSKVANGIRNCLTRENVRDVGCALRVFKKECVRDIPYFKGMHRFFPTLVRIQGFDKILEEPVNHRHRERGITKYGISNRLWVGIYDLFAVRWMMKRMVFPKVEEKK